MLPMETLHQSIKPTSKPSVYSILSDLGYDLSDWKNVKGGRKPSQNPKYCYNWSFKNPKKSIALCIWYLDITDNDHTLIQANNLRDEPVSDNPIKLATWKRRARAVDKHLQAAYLGQLPLYAIILSGDRRDRTDPTSDSSSVEFRRLDTIKWAVTEYDFESGDYVLTRGVKPVTPFGQPLDPETASYKEGALRRAFRAHRHREWRARRDKIEEALRIGGGKLLCEVPRCGFNFRAKYGPLGAGYAHVHHLTPLGSVPKAGTQTKLDELAIVCPNCHAMIHLGGECRPLETLIPASTD